MSFHPNYIYILTYKMCTYIKQWQIKCGISLTKCFNHRKCYIGLTYAGGLSNKNIFYIFITILTICTPGIYRCLQKARACVVCNIIVITTHTCIQVQCVGGFISSHAINIHHMQYIFRWDNNNTRARYILINLIFVMFTLSVYACNRI